LSARATIASGVELATDTNADRGDAAFDVENADALREDVDPLERGGRGMEQRLTWSFVRGGSLITMAAVPRPWRPTMLVPDSSIRRTGSRDRLWWSGGQGAPGAESEDDSGCQPRRVRIQNVDREREGLGWSRCRSGRRANDRVEIQRVAPTVTAHRRGLPGLSIDPYPEPGRPLFPAATQTDDSASQPGFHGEGKGSVRRTPQSRMWPSDSS